MGVERQYEAAAARAARRGRRAHRPQRPLLASYHASGAGAGRDVVSPSTRPCNARRKNCCNAPSSGGPSCRRAAEPAGGAIVVMDVHDGAIRAAASAPAFDPNLFVAATHDELAALLADPAHPLFDRVCQHGDSARLDVQDRSRPWPCWSRRPSSPDEPFFCQGYLHRARPAAMRNLRPPGHRPRRGDAGRRAGRKLQRLFLPLRRPDGAAAVGRLGRAVRLRPADRRRSARRGGRHAALAGEHRHDCEGHALAHHRHAIDGHRAGIADGHAAAGGAHDGGRGQRRAAGHAACGASRVRDGGSGTRDGGAATAALLSISPHTLQTIREGLRRVVADPQGTAHGTVYLDSIAIAGKTGTAETGADRPATPGLPATCRPTIPSWRLSWSWNTPATPPRPPVRWPSGWCCGWSSWECCNPLEYPDR